MKKRPEPKAIDRFMAYVGEIQTTLGAIQEAADDHFDVDPESVNWANVGDVKAVLDHLKNALAASRGEIV